MTDRLFCTVGVHPTRCLELEEYPDGTEAYIRALMDIIEEGKAIRKVVAVGECGLGAAPSIFALPCMPPRSPPLPVLCCCLLITLCGATIIVRNSW